MERRESLTFLEAVRQQPRKRMLIKVIVFPVIVAFSYWLTAR